MYIREIRELAIFPSIKLLNRIHKYTDLVRFQKNYNYRCHKFHEDVSRDYFYELDFSSVGNLLFVRP